MDGMSREAPIDSAHSTVTPSQLAAGPAILRATVGVVPPVHGAQKLFVFGFALNPHPSEARA